jgi:hypothetical protein
MNAPILDPYPCGISKPGDNLPERLEPGFATAGRPPQKLNVTAQGSGLHPCQERLADVGRLPRLQTFPLAK